MRPFPLHLDLQLRRSGDRWPDCRGQAGVAALECLFSLNSGLARQVGMSGWRFEWLVTASEGHEPAVSVPAILESVTTETYPKPGAPRCARVGAQAVVRSDVTPSPEAVGDLGFRVARRVSGAEWRFGEEDDSALINVVSVRLADSLRDRTELYCAEGMLADAFPAGC